jgi:NAD(P)-dependent dehydrogenase (short-subunit alcohol dehydrogenase family)
MTARSLEGKVAVITGAGSGMGKASAKVFAREGAKLVISDISGAQARTAEEIGGDVVAMRCDISDESQVAALIDAAVSKFGRLDAMLNVAGIASGAMIESVEETDLDRIIDVNMKGVFWGVKYAVRAMKANGGGAIVNWSSLVGLTPIPGCSAYNMTKAGVAMLTKSTAIEYGPHNIRCNAMAPGMILTEGMGREGMESNPSRATRNPLRRPGAPEDAGELAAFLASDRAAYINGVIIPLDGGWGAMLA